LIRTGTFYDVFGVSKSVDSKPATSIPLVSRHRLFAADLSLAERILIAVFIIITEKIL
jgi:hypothetical protein